MYEYKALTLPCISEYSLFLPQNIQQRISNLTPDFTLILTGASENEIPIGLCVALLDLDLQLLEILHIEVKKEYRNQHIGRTLLKQTEEGATKKGSKIFSFIYPQGGPETQAIEKIIAANQWSGTRPFLIKAFFDTPTFNALALYPDPDRAYPKGYKEFCWKSLTEAQRKDLLYREKQGHFSRAFSPFLEENILDDKISLGLEYQGRVIGWMITHRIDEQTLRYSALYIEPNFKYTGLPIKLLANAILLQQKNSIKWAVFEISYLQSHPSWLRLIKRRFLPYAFNVTYLRQAWKT